VADILSRGTEANSTRRATKPSWQSDENQQIEPTKARSNQVPIGDGGVRRRRRDSDSRRCGERSQRWWWSLAVDRGIPTTGVDCGTESKQSRSSGNGECRRWHLTDKGGTPKRVEIGGSGERRRDISPTTRTSSNQDEDWWGENRLQVLRVDRLEKRERT
jgi:hypothetical protein